MSFGKSKAKLITKDMPKTTFADVAGADEAVEELEEIKEFLARPGQVPGRRRQDPQGRPALRPARHRQDAAGPRRGRRGRRPVLLDLRLGLRRDVRRRRRLAACATCSSRPRPTPRPSSSSTRSTPSAATAAPASAAATTSASRPSTSCSSRWTASTSPAASSSSPPPTGPTSSTRRCCARAASTGRSRSSAPTSTAATQILKVHAKGKPMAAGRRPRGRRPAHPGLHRRRPGQRAQRGRAAHRAHRRGS